MTRKRPNLTVRILRRLRPWHRRIGISSTVFVIFMAVSGILINHSNQLSFDTTHVEQRWLLDYYGIKAPANINLFQQAPQQIVSAGRQVWLDGQLILEANNSVLAVMIYQRMIIAVDSQHLYLMSPQGELLETQNSATGLPTPIQKVGLQNGLWLRTQPGDYMADPDLINWSPAQPLTAISWVTALANTDHEALTTQIRASHLNWERVLLDLHSGRFWGSIGVWIVDLIAIALLIMAMSGCYIWLKQKPTSTKRNRK
ncbi:PepSY-associated TM helix domain-containing protein [Shewanella youngdeokensis]|uniref:PepSY domain-containing protein n=1 Tax=Shewanella youngdeokensis TaxID=2999068 RepID=A0ABZ0JZD8_9GAMM|nr:PepSY domain-containing protein [Shewanella sp. DAU334]